MVFSVFLSFVSFFLAHKKDQVYSNTRAPTQVKSTRVNTNPTRVRHEPNTSQHESDTTQHESTQVKKCARWLNMSQHKSDTSLTPVNLS